MEILEAEREFAVVLGQLAHADDISPMLASSYSEQGYSTSAQRANLHSFWRILRVGMESQEVNNGSRDSVFFKLAKDENSFTELLCNLLMLRDEFRAQVLPLLLPEIPHAKFSGVEIYTQGNFECNKPDLVIQKQDLLAFIESKINPRRELTPRQDIGSSEDEGPKCYLDFLDERRGKDAVLVYLVPGDWKDMGELKSRLAAARKTHRYVKTGICTWEDILQAIENNTDQIVNEFRVALRRQLGLINMTPEERRMFASKDFSISFTTLRKLEKLVDEVAKPLGLGNGAKNRAETEEEYGVYAKTRSKEFLFFGLWNIEGRVNLCYAISAETDNAALSAFGKFFGPENVRAVGTDGKWTIFPIPVEVLESDLTKAISKIRHQLAALLNELCGRIAA